MRGAFLTWPLMPPVLDPEAVVGKEHIEHIAAQNGLGYEDVRSSLIEFMKHSNEQTKQHHRKTLPLRDAIRIALGLGRLPLHGMPPR